MALAEPIKKGGPYTKKEQEERRLEVSHLHFEEKLSAVKIAELLNVNRNTINDDIKFWCSQLAKEMNVQDLNAKMSKQIQKMDMQRERLFDELEKEYQTKMGAGSAKAKAAGDALEATKIKNAQKRRTKLKQAAVWNNLSKILDESENINATAKDIMSVDTARKFSNVQGRIQNVENKATY